MLRGVRAHYRNDDDAVVGSAGALALRIREDPRTRRMMIVASPLGPPLMFWPPLLASLLVAGASSTDRLGLPGSRTNSAIRSLLRSLVIRRTSRLTFWWLSLLATMNPRLSRWSSIVCVVMLLRIHSNPYLQ